MAFSSGEETERWIVWGVHKAATNQLAQLCFLTADNKKAKNIYNQETCDVVY